MILRDGFLAALVLVSGMASAQNGDPYLATIVTERAAGVVARLPERVSATLHVPNVAQSVAVLSGIDGVDVIASQHDSVRIAFGADATVPHVVSDAHLENSFVIDFEEPTVRELLDDMRIESGERLSIEQITRLVFDHIDDKTYSRAFDLASQVAASGAGDCTEHAVLLAAIARANAYPARVILGMVMLDTTERSAAYGHAWTEVYDGERWRIADGTLPGLHPGAAAVRYLPLAPLDNEGPGYMLALMQAMSIMPTRVTEVAPAP